MPSIAKGMLAGFAATVVLSGLMMIKTMMGAMPELDVIGMLANMAGSSATMGWIAHFAIGTVVWGGAFAVLNGVIPGNRQVVKGIVFGLLAWVGMMVAIMPMAGMGLFGLSLGPMAPVMTAVLHIIFGAVLGWVYERLSAGALRSA